MTRLDLSFYGINGSGEKTFQHASLLTGLVLLIIMVDKYLNDLSYASTYMIAVYFIYILYATTITRKFIRAKDFIPSHSHCCGECEDFCCALFCNCCVITQLARHTADYNTYTSYCCTKNGLPPGISEEHAEPLL